MSKMRTPYISSTTKKCECGCGTLIAERDSQYRIRRFAQGHQRRKEAQIVICKCGCGESFPENTRKEYATNKSYRKRLYVPGHQNRRPKSYGKQILCACGCGEWITEYRYKNAGRNRYKVKFQKGHGCKGNLSHFWQGGKTEEAKRFKQSGEYCRWRKAVFERDNYTCQHCGIRNNKVIGKTIELHPDHIKPYSLYPDLRTTLSNGRTLCVDCHRKTDTYGIKLVHGYRQNTAC